MLNYTTEELLLYVYNELPEDELRAMEKAIESDWDLHEQLNAIRASMNHLDEIVESPRPQSVAAILNYAKSSAEVEHS